MINYREAFTILAWLVLVILLLCDLELRHRSNLLTEQFRIVRVETNGFTATVVVDSKTANPLWGKLASGSGEDPVAVNYFFDGKNVMNIYPLKGEPPQMDVTFFEPTGRIKSVWVNRGTNDGFTERRRYDLHPPVREIWFSETWHPLEYHTNDGQITAGIVLDGKWRHALFTNRTTLIGP